MKLICEIELPDNASFKTKLDAMAQASRDESKWREVYTRSEMQRKTNLDNKCGSCKHFEPKYLDYSKCLGDCKKGRARYRQRTCPACKLYERKTET